VDRGLSVVLVEVHHDEARNARLFGEPGDAIHSARISSEEFMLSFGERCDAMGSMTTSLMSGLSFIFWARAGRCWLTSRIANLPALLYMPSMISTRSRSAPAAARRGRGSYRDALRGDVNDAPLMGV